MQEETLLTCRRFRVVRRRYRAADGTEHVHDSVQHPGAVTIVPMVDDEHVCLIRNHRVAVDETLIELPAGTLEPNEPPIETARRELIEETGFTAGRIEPLCQFFMSPGILNERMHVFLALDLKPGPTRRESGEEIENLVVTWGEALRLCESGEIQDAKSLAAILFYDRFRRRR
ncbi:MAG: NUDIX hydrolase [Planctomycetes bacterium]|nr:NUDIX hydrolase [Planctomycetota bacterium]